MKRHRFLRRPAPAASLASILMLSAGTASAAGFQLQEQSASGLGVAYSGMAAAVQDASTAFWNPAGMTRLQGINLAGAVHYIAPDTKFNDSGSTYSAFGDGGQGGESAFVPALHATWMIDPQWAVGLTINAPYGLATKWNKSWAGQFHGNKSELETLNINPSVAFKVNEMLSLGLGVSYQKLKATLTSAVTPAIPGSIGQVEGDDWQWGWNAGVLVDFQQGTRLGITYRAETDYKIEGDFTINTPALAGLQSDVKADVKLPATASIGLSHQLDPQIRLLADYTWTGWDSIQELDIVRTSGPLSGRSVTTTQLGFENSYRVGLGVEYQLNQPWLLRVGVAYDTSPVQDAERTPRLPDNDRTWLSIGARYAPEPNWSVDVGYAYIWVDDASSSLAPTGAEAFKGTLNGSYKGHVQIFALQGNFRF